MVPLFFFFTLTFSLPAGKDSKAEVAPASPVVLVPEEKVSFSLYALSVLTLTVAKIRKSYNKLDSKAIAKQVRRTTLQGIKSHCFNVVVTAGFLLNGNLTVRYSVKVSLKNLLFPLQ